MKERPILFSAPMVRAILDGSKTQTRRIVKPQPFIDDMGNFCWNGMNFGQDFDGPHIQAIASPVPSSKTKRVHCPYGKPGDRLWVRETWAAGISTGCSWHAQEGPVDQMQEFQIRYRSDGDDGFFGKWRPSIFMPRRYSRITLEITGARVQRLQDINEADAIAEGIKRHYSGWWPYKTMFFEADGVTPANYLRDPRDSYRQLWESINGDGSWSANSWVWVVEFRRIKP